jgi:nucleoside phosphorylase
MSRPFLKKLGTFFSTIGKLGWIGQNSKCTDCPKDNFMPLAVILTALPVEYLAVRTHIKKLHEEMHPRGTIYERGMFTANNQAWEVGIAKVGAGNVGASVEAERAITYFKPDILFFVGIAGGIKDVVIGDVVVANKVYDYESGKHEDEFFTRPNLGKSNYALVNRAESEARKGEWLKRLSDSSNPQPRVFVAPIAAGEKVVASKQSEIFRLLRTSYNDAIAVEMEGFGFLSAAFAYPELKAIVIRGISDLIEGKNDDSVEPEEYRQEKASRHASAFAFELLAKLVIEEQKSIEQGLKCDTSPFTTEASAPVSSSKLAKLNRLKEELIRKEKQHHDLQWKINFLEVRKQKEEILAWDRYEARIEDLTTELNRLMQQIEQLHEEIKNLERQVKRN